MITLDTTGSEAITCLATKDWWAMSGAECTRGAEWSKGAECKSGAEWSNGDDCNNPPECNPKEDEAHGLPAQGLANSIPDGAGAATAMATKEAKTTCEVEKKHANLIN